MYPPDAPQLKSRLDLLYLVTREFNADLEIDQVLQNVLTATVAAIGASDADLVLFDSNENAARSLSMSCFEMTVGGTENLDRVAEEGIVDWVRNHQEGVLIHDTRLDDRWYDHKSSCFNEARSAVCAPIQLPDQFIGVLTVTNCHPNEFSDEDLAMLRIIADQAAFALSNARLFEAEQERRRLADTLISITQTINSTLDLDEVLNLILEQLRLVVEYDSASILLYEDDDKSLAVRAANGFDDMEDALNVRLAFNEYNPNFQAIVMKMPIFIPDVDQEPSWIKSSSSRQVRSWIGAPLLARGEVVGILTVDSHEVDKYVEDNVRVVDTFATHAAIAVANAQTVAQLQSAEATYSVLFEDSTDMIVISDYNGRILDINRKGCLLLRRHKDVFLNSDIAFIDPRLKKHLTEQTERLKVWREASIEVEVKDAYRKPLPLEINVRQLQYKGKECVEWVGRDISARKEVEQMRQDMVNMLIHDLRGPIGNIINVIELLKMMIEPQLDDPKVHNLLELGKRSGQSLTDLVDSMLDVSRLEQGEIPVELGLTNVSELVQTVEDQVEPQANAKSMSLKIEPVPPELEGWLDSNLIRRVLVNLIGNAIKYTPREGHIELNTIVIDDQVQFAISDDGPGIKKGDQKHIFDKFSRVEQTANTATGVGLGLAFCKLAVEAHNGTISVESEGIPGTGSTFYVTLPIANPSKE